jgi:nitrate reductase NapE component
MTPGIVVKFVSFDLTLSHLLETHGEIMNSKVKSGALIPILSVNFVGTLGFGIVLPF